MRMKTEYRMLPAIAAGIVFALGAATAAEIPLGGTVDDIWKSSEWISFAGAKVADEDCRQRQAAAEGTAEKTVPGNGSKGEDRKNRINTATRIFPAFG